VSWRRSWAIVRQDGRLLRRDPAFTLSLVIMPVMVVSFMKPAFRATLIASGARGANGAEQAVPGVAVTFAFLMVGNVGFGVFREHGWNTWERLRASWARPGEVILGKAVVPFAALALEMGILFGLGGLVFGLHVRGSVVGLILVAATLAVCLICFGFALLAVCRSIMQLNAASNLGALAYSGLGGAFTPISALPGWAHAIAPATPSYWAMRGFRSVILSPGGLDAVMLPTAVLLAFATGFVCIAAYRFRFDEAKVGWA
jgi:ABC-2 type transport system permease protein